MTKSLVILGGLGIVSFFLLSNASAKAGNINYTTTPGIQPTSDFVTDSNKKDTLDKYLSDNVDTEERTFVIKLWKKAQPYVDTIDTYSKQLGVPTTLVYAIINKESVFNPVAIRYEANIKEKAFGLMQIIPSTARWLGFNEDEFRLIDPTINILYGMKYLAYQLNRYKGDVSKAVAAYNAGSVKYSAGKFINQSYVNDVLRVYNLLNKVIIKE